MLVGEFPKPAGLLQSVRKSLLSVAPALPLPGLIFPPVRIAAQEVDAALDCHSLPHIRLGFAELLRSVIGRDALPKLPDLKP